MDITPQHLKVTSRIKHVILQKYLPAWSNILGSANSTLGYVDCYAGPGVYEHGGVKSDGSPVIAVKAADRYLEKNPGRRFFLFLVEEDESKQDSLEQQLEALKPYREGLRVLVVDADAINFVPVLLARSAPIPNFFMVDPYGHPLTIPILNQILARPRTEALITFMYFILNRDIDNPVMKQRVDKMFGDDDWRQQHFLSLSGQERETAFLDYFESRIEAKFKFHFRIKFDPEDKNQANRTKYYLVHASNNIKAVLLMKDVMHPLGDEIGTFAFGGTKSAQGSLFRAGPSSVDLEKQLLERYRGNEVEYDTVREETWKLPFADKEYRAVIKEMEKKGQVEIARVTSKKTGLKERDRIRFK